MPIASDTQVQHYVDERLRRRAEEFRSLHNAALDDKAAIDDIYQAVTQETPTWTDDRTDGPPRLLTPQDVLVYNAIVSIFIKIVAGTASSQEVAEFASNWAVFQSACVRPVNG